MSLILTSVLASVLTLSNWEFTQDEKTWKPVNVPHDWAIAGPFNKTNDMQVVAIKEDGETKAKTKTGRSGALPWIGEGAYRTTIDLTDRAAARQKVAFVFGAAMSEPEVFWDGAKIGEWKYGYTTFCVKVPEEKVTAGRHELLVKCRNVGESSRWYPGAGLIRPVYQVVDEDDPEGVVLGRPEKRAKLPKIELKENDGFYINGEKVKFQGVCLHHDLGSIGAAWNADAFRRQVRKLKEIGVNAIRTSHNPPLAEQLDICDEEGIWVMAESFDEWRNRKCSNGYNRFYNQWWKRDLEQLIKVCKDHPCVVMYSIGNEIGETRSGAGCKMMPEMRDFIHALDPSRPVTMGMNGIDRVARVGNTGLLDLDGYNYGITTIEGLRGKFTKGIVLGTETASSVSSRGVYHAPIFHKDRENPHGDGQCNDYDTDHCSWSNLPDEDFALIDDNDWIVGQFVWTGFDYLGEPSPYNEYWPSRSSYFGLFDLAGLPKNRAYLYRSQWRKDVHTVHLLPHWNWKAGDKVTLACYTDGDSAELFVNGKSHGVAKKTPGPSDQPRKLVGDVAELTRYRLWWKDVPFEPGEVKVVAYKAGQIIGEDVVRTAGAFDHFTYDYENYPTLGYITVTAVDKNGTKIPDYNESVTIAVSGDARFRGLCNGDATSLEVFAEPKMRLFNGQLVVTVDRMESGVYSVAASL